MEDKKIITAAKAAKREEVKMKTLKEVIVNVKCRKGHAAGTTGLGAYWLACDPIKTHTAGGDGIGQSAPDIKWRLELRHFRSGEVRPTIHRSAWHQNGSWGGAGDDYFAAKNLADCVSAEEVVVALKNMDTEEDCIDNRYVDDVIAALTALGMDEAEQSPDEIMP